MGFETGGNFLRNLFACTLEVRNSKLIVTVLAEVSLAISELKYNKICTKAKRLQPSF